MSRPSPAAALKQAVTASLPPGPTLRSFKMVDTTKCAICLTEWKSDPHAEIVITQCGHTFHRKCADGVLALSNAPLCPLCREPIQEMHRFVLGWRKAPKPE